MLSGPICIAAEPAAGLLSRPWSFPLLPQHFAAGASPGLEDDGVTLMYLFSLHVSRHDKSLVPPSRHFAP